MSNARNSRGAAHITLNVIQLTLELKISARIGSFTIELAFNARWTDEESSNSSDITSSEPNKVVVGLTCVSKEDKISYL